MSAAAAQVAEGRHMKASGTGLRRFVIPGAAIAMIAMAFPVGVEADSGPTSAGQWTQAAQLGENLVGKPVYTRDGVEAGEVEKVMRSESQQVIGIVVTVGGMLGLGARSVLLKPEEVDVRREAGRTKVYLEITEKALEARSDSELGSVVPNKAVK